MTKQMEDKIVMGGTHQGKLTASELAILTMSAMSNSYEHLTKEKDKSQKWSIEDVKRNLLRGIK